MGHCGGNQVAVQLEEQRQWGCKGIKNDVIYMSCSVEC
jgi:hypothetical protein